MKIFQDPDAQKLFNHLYEEKGLTKIQQEQFGEAIRQLADKKVNSEDGEYKEFYVTGREVSKIYKQIKFGV